MSSNYDVSAAFLAAVLRVIPSLKQFFTLIPGSTRDFVYNKYLYLISFYNGIQLDCSYKVRVFVKEETKHFNTTQICDCNLAYRQARLTMRCWGAFERLQFALSAFLDSYVFLVDQLNGCQTCVSATKTNTHRDKISTKQHIFPRPGIALQLQL